MTNQPTPKHLAEAGLSLIEQHGWSAFSIVSLYQECGLDPTALSNPLTTKNDWLTCLQSHIITETKAFLPQQDLMDLSIKDRLLELTLTQFEILLPHRSALKPLMHGLVKEAQNYCTFQSMLRHGWEDLFSYADIPNTNIISRLRTEAFMGLYLVTLYRWLNGGLSADKLQSTLDQQLTWGNKLMANYR
ncbi:MAG: hypothetical protein CMM87_04365 [Rickettsiales bacterium]|nr:hypothetical protein [Rickettsiales bacterium]|tara:strand:+ start:4493 stop:5059 length:567 start_codon:yes stop_codon:yes gene_type:complete